jgi:ABC-2 type transport system ATP-binding protein
VDDVSFDVADGQLFCLLGPNGAGKTTTVSILTTTRPWTSNPSGATGYAVTAGRAQQPAGGWV